MISETWYSEIESTIFTLLQYVLVEKEAAPYPTLNCTTSSQNESLENVDDFPALYVHLLPPLEIGNDLHNEDITALRATLELQVFSDQSENECRKILNICIREMKKLHFNISMFPDPQTADKKYFAVARFTRIIAGGDADIVPEEEL